MRADRLKTPPLPLNVLLLRVADELHALQAEGRSLEDAIGGAILANSASTGEALHNLQGIDLIVQTLGELGDYLAAVAALVESDAPIDATLPLSRIVLRDLAAKLSGLDPACPARLPEAIRGEIDLF